jgi:small GTP-binding protein
MVLHRLLTDEQERILSEERRQLMALRGLLARLDAPPEDIRVLELASQQLDELFLLVIVGEFNSGKSAFVNALLGDRFLTEGVTPTTTEIQILKYGEKVSQESGDSDIQVLTYPVEWLQEINIVDTPGTNAVIQRHQEITEDFVPRADLVLFITSADRPFTESERTFLERVREWGKKVIFVVNKIDVLETPQDVERVIDFVEEHARELLGRRPLVFPVSARQARQAKQAASQPTNDNGAGAPQQQQLWVNSRFDPLERYILSTLDERERLRLKLSNPLGIARRLTARYQEVAGARRALLRDDVATIQTLQGQLAGYEADMRRDFKYHLSLVDNALYGMAERGNRFFDETIRLGRIFDLMNAEKVRGMFEREVVADTSAQVETATHDLIDWLVQEDFRQWQAVMDYLNRRINQYHERLVGQVGGQFEYNRQALLESVGRAARETVSSYDKEREARELAESVQMSVAQTALVEVGALGLGTLLVHLLATTLADVTGVLAATTVAALGLYLIPNRRQRAKLDLQAKIAELRSRLAQVMSAQFEKELSGSLERIRSAIRPYTRFVETQQAASGEIEAGLQTVERSLNDLAARVERG